MLQKRAIRVITKSPYYSHTKPIFTYNNLLNINPIKFNQTCEFVYKFHNNLLPPSFVDYFSLTSKIHSHNTRNNDDSRYRTIRTRTNIRKFAIQSQGPITWNSLPRSIRAATSLIQFKRLVRAHTTEYV